MTEDRGRPLRSGVRLGDLETLARSSLLSSLSPRELGVIVERMDEITVPAGAGFGIATGAEPAAAYIVLAGPGQLVCGGDVGVEVRPGSHFGLEALAGHAGIPATLRATGEVRLARLSRARYIALFQEHAALAVRLSQLLALGLADELAAARSRGAPRSEAAIGQIAVRIAGRVVSADAGTPLRSFLSPELLGSAVGGLLENRPVGLDTPITCDATVEPLLATMPEGRQLLLRSLGLVLLEAAYAVAPALHVAWGPALGAAHVVLVEPATPGEISALAPQLERAVCALVARAAPFREEQWGVERAIHHFRKMGWEDAAALLRTSRDPFVSLLTCGTLVVPRMGPLLATTRDVGQVRVRAHPRGFLVELEKDVPEREVGAFETQVDSTPRERSEPSFVGARTQRSWLDSLGITSVGAFNEACIAGRVDELVRVSEGFHEKRVSQLADTVADRGRAVRVIRMAGPSASGKTTFIERLKVQLQINGLRPVNLSLDDYYVDRDKTPRDDRGELDFESVRALDGALLQRHVRELLSGRTVKTARFDFLTGKAQPEGGHELTMVPGDILVLEGLHALNPELLGECAGCGQSFGIFVHPATTLPFDRLNALAADDLRLLRRIVRDRFGRGYSAAENIVRWPSVRRGELAHVFPSEAYADAVFDSSLVYELSVLKVFAERYLLEVPRDHVAFPTALRLRNLIDHFVAIYPDHVPPTSMLREFIGGGAFDS